MRLVALLAAVAAAAPCFAANWLPVIDKNGYSLKVDAASIRQEDGTTQAWFIWTYDQSRKAPNTGDYLVMRALWHFNCEQRKAGAAFAAYYRTPDSEEPFFRESVDPARLDPLIPESVGETMALYACAKRPTAKN